MPKSDPSRPLAAYSTVAERVTLFYARFPTGRILTHMVSRSERDVVFRAVVYRAGDDRRPAATGWAAEREGDGDVNTVACLENTETSAVGRALANLGLTAARERPSAEEMAKAARARARSVRLARDSAPPAQTGNDTSRVSDRHPSTARQKEDGAGPSGLMTDVLRLVAAAERAGVRSVRAARWRERLRHGAIPEESLLRIERRLRAWLTRRQR